MVTLLARSRDQQDKLRRSGVSLLIVENTGCDLVS